MRIAGAIFVLFLTASAMTERLSGSEIRDWLSGNTVIGAWAGTPYRQYFRTNGTTAYKADGVALDEGRWWVTETEYCSWWQGSGEACYEVHRDGDELIWRRKSAFKRGYTAEVVIGDKLQVR
jgi:hypothetical protein